MKKFLFFVITILLACSLSACDADSDIKQNNDTEKSVTDAVHESDTEAETETDTTPESTEAKDGFVSRVNGNWVFSINSTDGINLVIFADGSFIKAYTVNGATSPDKIITGTYKILADDGTYQDFLFTPSYEGFEEWSAKLLQTKIFDADLGMYEGLVYISEDGKEDHYKGEKFPD